MSVGEVKDTKCQGHNDCAIGHEADKDLESLNTLNCAKKRSSLSKYFVSLEVRTDMRKKRTSTRVLLKASVTTVMVITLVFVVLYTIALRYFTTISPLPYDSWRRHRLRLIAKSKQDNHSRILETRGRMVKWNISAILGAESPLLCRQDIDYLILIASHTDNYQRRRAIRSSWCKPNEAWQCVFLIGHSKNPQGEPEEISSSLKQEIETHNDVLLGSYIDTYRNLTLKIMHGLYWMNSKCITNIVLKTDDDCFVHTKLLHSLILHHQDARNLYTGHVETSDNIRRVIRNKENRWHVLKSEYSSEFYPPYASGAGYLLSADVVRRFIRICNYVQRIPIEDAYIGILAKELGLEPSNSARFTLENSGWTTCNYGYLIVIHKVEPNVQETVLNMTHRAKNECPNSRAILTWN